MSKDACAFRFLITSSDFNNARIPRLIELERSHLVEEFHGISRRAFSIDELQSLRSIKKVQAYFMCDP